MNSRRQIYYFVIAIAIGFALYIPFRSIQWDVNGLIESRSVDAGDATMFSANHMLYRPLGYSIFQLARLFGYAGKSAPILQYVTALSATLGIGFFFLCVYNLTARFGISLLATLLLGTSWSYWKFSTDISYIIPAAACVCAALLLLQTAKTARTWRIITLGFVTGLSVLFWQANIFLIPSFLVAMGDVSSNNEYVHRRWRTIALFLAAFGLTVSLAYVAVPKYVFGINELKDIIEWGARHGTDIGGRPPMWGKWEIDRLMPAGINLVASFIPIWQGLGLRRLLAGDLQLEKILPLLSLAALIILGGTSLSLLYRRLLDKSLRVRRIVWLLMGYVFYLPFIVWWEPFETRWFLIPNIFLVLAIAFIWNTELDKNPGSRWVYLLSGCILVIGVANFSSTIWTYHSVPSPRMQVAQCFAENTTTYDSFIPTDWNWFDYSDYFFDFQGTVMDLRRGNQYDQQNIALIEAELESKYGLNGSIYVMSLSSYSLDEINYFENQAGFPIHLLTKFEQNPAFTCNEVQFMKIVRRKAE